MTLLEDFMAGLKFPLDDFQRRACESIASNRGVLVCAPTGAGKTIVGEFAIAAALNVGGKCFYTTPIKALSNQKYHDLVAQYGADQVGLLTGDVSIKGDADIVVMTTEVLRNMLYADSEQLPRLEFVVMDEIHYLADIDRGAVWEEVILNLHEDVKVVGLSATVSNSEEFGQWLTTVRGHTDVIVTDFRPVPLNQFMAVGGQIVPMFHPESATNGTTAPAVNPDLKQLCAQSDQKAETTRYRPPKRSDVVRQLQAENMLPAIVFIFSRVGCDAALQQLGMSRIELTNGEEQQRIAQIIDEGITEISVDDLQVLGFRKWRRFLLRGFAAHHAGMLPAFRHIVEKLFNEGLVKVVFATETLALGINMPARTVVLEKLVKFNGEAHVDLTPGQYTQMTGRAGRRGIDTVGNAVVQWAPAMDPQWVASLAATRTYPLISTFQPTYNMSINVLRTLGYAEGKKMMERSFAQFQTNGDVVEIAAQLERARRKQTQLTNELNFDGAQGREGASAPNLDDVVEYLDIRTRLSDAEKEAKRRSLEQRFHETVVALRRLRRGEVIAIPVGKKVQLAVVSREDHDKDKPRPAVIGANGYTGRIKPEMFTTAPRVLGRIRLPHDAARRPQAATKLVKSEIRNLGLKTPKRIKPAPRPKDPEVAKLRKALRSHKLHRDPAIDAVARQARELTKVRAEVARLESQVANAQDTLAQMFDRTLELLTELEYVEEGALQVTSEGERLAKIHNGSDLLTAQCLRKGIWDELDPAELAAVVSAISFESRKTVEGSDEVPTEALATALTRTFRVWEQVAYDERRYRLPTTRMPEIAFATAIHQWTSGAPLGYCLAAAANSGAELTPGDFVRSARRVVDLLQQVRNTGYSEEIRSNAAQAVDAIRRGVVAIGS